MTDLKCPDCGKWINCPTHLVRDIKLCRCDDVAVKNETNTESGIWEKCDTAKYIKSFVEFEERREHANDEPQQIPKCQEIVEPDYILSYRIKRFINRLLP